VFPADELVTRTMPGTRQTPGGDAFSVSLLLVWAYGTGDEGSSV